MIGIILLTLVYCFSCYGFSLFLYDQWSEDEKFPEDVPDGLIHTIVFVFALCWPVTIFVLSCMRVLKKA